MNKFRIYIDIGKPLVFKKFKEYVAPTGWIRLDLLKERLKMDKTFKAKFTDKEVKEINKVDE